MNAAVRAAASVMPALPRGLGDRRAAQGVYRRLLAGREGQRATAKVGGATMELSLGDWPQAQAYLLRRYDPSTVAFVTEHLPAIGVFVEGGSHVGLIALQVAAARPQASLHAFEPHPVKFGALERNVAANQARVSTNNLGLSDANGVLAYDSDRHAIDSGGGDRIGVTTLDNYAAQHALAHIDVLKLDIEGHELSALHGAAELLSGSRIGAVTLESLHGDTSEPMRYLESFGYRRVAMPDTRAPWLTRRRPMPLENVGYVLPASRLA